jgi:two-component system, OmpR family, sensor histidine kinase MtrB
MTDATAMAPEAPELDALEAPERWIDPPDARRRARERRVARDLVELSRLQRGAERAEFARVDLAHLLRAIVADHPGVVLDGPATARTDTDSRRLARILFILLENAVLHGAPPIAVHYDQRMITVSDGGRGFPAGLRRRATEPFVTGERTNGRGIGLGLAIAERHAGVLGAQLILGDGSAGGASVTVRFAPALPTAE